MIGFDTFKDYLNATIAQQNLVLSHIGNQGQNLRAWSASLGMRDEAQQCREIEKVMSELIIIDMPDAERMRIMAEMYPTLQRFVAQLRHHYIFEASVISAEQVHHANQVKSLYYLAVLICDGVARRYKAPTTPAKPSAINTHAIKALLKRNAIPEEQSLLVHTLYAEMGYFLHLLMEQAVVYQRPSDLYWRKLNSLYHRAVLAKVEKLAITDHPIIHGAQSIAELYQQACLHSLLGLSSYRRQDIIGVQKLLPTWAQKMHLTESPTEQHRLFVDLNDDLSPVHVTVHAKVNPYDAERHCVFLDVGELTEYLKTLTADAHKDPTQAIQSRLAKTALYTLQSQTGRREERKVSFDKATVVSGFALIHYYMAGKKPLNQLIAHHTLPIQFLPKHNTTPKSGYTQQHIVVELMDTSSTGCRFRWQIEPLADNKNVPAKNSAQDAKPSGLQVLSLFAMQMHPTENRQSTDQMRPNLTGQWQLGLIRWIESRDEMVEAGGRIIGYRATACGVRLESKDTRSQDFVAGLLLAGDEKLGSTTTLLLPRYHFRSHDKVMLRIGEKQSLLRLEQVVLASDDFEQYEVTRL